MPSAPAPTPDPVPYPRPPRARALRALAWLAGAAFAALAWVLLAPVHPLRRVVPVPVGSSLGQVAAGLERAGAVRSARAFKWLALLEGRSGKIKAGDYGIPPGLNLVQTLNLLVSGRSLMQPLLVPEGFSSAQIAAELGRLGLCSPDRFLALVRDPSAARRFGVPGPTLEGYLFPDTYFLPRGVAPETVVRMMVARFHQEAPAALLAQGRKVGLNPRQVVTLASIVEKEAREDVERPLIAGVFRNRLLKRQRLESCATVRYALGRWSGPLYDKDLFVRSRYNTYRHAGLPPGPICSPGLKSIQAALHPAATDALFFVVRGDGGHIFAKTYQQFLKAKARWKRLKRGEVEE